METVIIKNFKNIEDLRIDSVGKVNLIAGRNNVGKTTLLEAISVYAGGGNVLLLDELLRSRGEYSIYEDYRTIEDGVRNGQIESITSLFHNHDLAKRIVIGESDSDSQSVSIEFIYYVEETEVDSQGNERKIKKIVSGTDRENERLELSCGVRIINVSKNNESPAIIIPIDGKSGRFMRSSMVNSNYLCKFVRANSLSRDENSRIWDDVSLLDERKYVIEALQIIEPNIRDLQFVEEGGRERFSSRYVRVPKVRIEGQVKPYRLSAMGDGINKILTIILGMVGCRDGILLIDEFENGLHYTVQSKLWKIIFMLSKKLNIQVFATTHSEDCIAGFAMENKEGKGEVIRLEKKNGQIIGVNYDERKIKIALERGIEIR